MKLTVDCGKLNRALTGIRGVIERRNTIPILAHVLMRTDGASLHIKATNLDMEMTDKIEATIETAGAITVPGNIFSDIIKKMPAGAEVSLQLDDQNLIVKSGRSRFKIVTLPAEDFPDLTVETEGATSFAMPAKTLRHLFGKTEFAISSEETRYYLNGIYFHGVTLGNRRLLRAVATDGHRLARIQCDAPAGAEGLNGVIVPRMAVAQVLKIMPAEDDIEVQITSTKVVFSFGNVRLVSKLIDGTFPDYERVIPAGNDKLVTADRAPFKQAVDRVTTISSERGRAIKLSFSSGQLVLEVNNPDSGHSSDQVDADYTGDPIEIGFNSRYMLDVLGEVETGKLQIKLADPGSPTIFMPDGDEDAVYILMPMRV